MEFKDLKLHKDICDALQSLGLTNPTEVQQKAIPVVLEHKDVVVRSETGSGKTFAFALPIINMLDKSSTKVEALVVCPTRELAMQVADEIKKIAEPQGIKVCAVFGGSTITRQVDALKKKPQIIVGTTGRIVDLINKGALKIESANFVVLDEADEMLDMGFRPDIEKIFAHTKKDRQTMLFSATIPDEIKQIASQYQTNSVLVEIGTANKALDKIKQTYIFVNKKQKKEALKELLYSEIFDKTLVFVNTKVFAQDIEHFLRKSKINAMAIHGDLRQNRRKQILDAFKSGKCDILIATDVASRGLDIKGVKFVINFDLPHELEFYVHRIGRTARAGESGEVINIITSFVELSSMRDIEKQTKAKIDAYSTNNQNLQNYFVDTKKLAQQNNRFAKKSQNDAFDGFEVRHFDKKSQNGKSYSGKFNNKKRYVSKSKNANGQIENKKTKQKNADGDINFDVDTKQAKNKKFKGLKHKEKKHNFADLKTSRQTGVKGFGGKSKKLANKKSEGQNFDAYNLKKSRKKANEGKNGKQFLAEKNNKQALNSQHQNEKWFSKFKKNKIKKHR